MINYPMVTLRRERRCCRSTWPGPPNHIVMGCVRWSEGFPEEATFKLRSEGRAGWGRRPTGCWEDFTEGSWGELPATPWGPSVAEGEEKEFQMRPEVGRMVRAAYSAPRRKEAWPSSSPIRPRNGDG